MNINRHNCEAFFLDYYEKNLSPVETAELLLFLEENPDLKEVFDAYEAFFLEQEKSNFPYKEYLKKKFSGNGIDEILASEINRTNCEEFFIASAEELLSNSQKEKLNTFLSENPDLKNVFLLYQKCKLSQEKISFERKELLKKEIITEQNCEEYFIRAIENQLNDFEKKELNLFLQKHPHLKKEFELFQKTILIPEKISFKWKSRLKKRKPVFISLHSRQMVYYAVAASVLLLIGLFFFFRNTENNGNNTAFMANNTKEATHKIVNAKSHYNTNTAEERKENIQSNSYIETKKSIPSTGDATKVKKHNYSPANHKTTDKKEKNIIQPVVSEDNDNFITQKEEPQIQIIEIAEEEKKNTPAQLTTKGENVNAENQKETNAVTTNRNLDKKDEYITLSAFINKKIKSFLGIKNTDGCEESDKIRLWDLAMAVKNGIQKIIGTEAVDIKKVCDGTGEKVEYVFILNELEFAICSDVSNPDM
jgi:hypothetical protein